MRRSELTRRRLVRTELQADGEEWGATIEVFEPRPDLTAPMRNRREV